MAMCPPASIPGPAAGVGRLVYDCVCFFFLSVLFRYVFFIWEDYLFLSTDSRAVGLGYGYSWSAGFGFAR